MSESGFKRRREDSDDGLPSKSHKVEEFLDSMDPSVRIKLRSMFDDGLLQTADLDERNISELSKFDAAVALEILEHYCGGDLSKVRNRRAYLAGAIRRRSHLVRPEHQPTGTPHLHPDVERRLNQIKQAIGKAGDLDGRSLDALAGLPPSRALTALDRYGSKDFSEVRNPSALFMSILRSVSDLPPGGGGGGGGPDWDHHYRGRGGDGYGPPPYDRGGPPPGPYGGGGGGDGYGPPRGPPSSGGGGYGRDRGGGYGEPEYDRDYYHNGPGGPGGQGGPGQPPPPPPRRGPPPAAAAPVQHAALPPGALVAQQAPDGSLVLTMPTVLGGLPPGAVAAAPAAAAPPTASLVLTVGPGGTQQYTLVSTAGGQLPAQAPGGQLLAAAPGGQLLTAAPGGQLLVGGAAPPAGATLVAAPGGYIQASAAAAPAAAVQPAPEPLPPGVPPEWAAGRRHHGADQAQLGVRVGEFHGLSPFSCFLHPSAALKLQQLWDSGNELVSMLDDKVWQTLAELPAPEALAAIQEAADVLGNPGAGIRNINAFVISVVRKLAPPAHDPRHPSSGGGSGPPSSSGGRPDYYSGGGGPGPGPAYSSGPYSSGGRRGGGYDGDGYHARDGGGRGAGVGGGGGGPGTRGPGIHLLSPDLQAQARALCADHAPLLREDHFDEGVVAMLQRLPEQEARSVLTELGGNSLAGVRNMSAYIMGVVRRYLQL